MSTYVKTSDVTIIRNRVLEIWGVFLESESVSETEEVDLISDLANDSS